MRKLYIRTLLALVLITLSLSKTLAQTEEEQRDKTFFIDYTMGTYLLIDDLPYESLILQGTRLGYRINNRFAVAIEYILGQQEDVFGDLGLTHHASAQAAYFLNEGNRQFRPYLYVGGGFLEFKSFTSDQLGVGYYSGIGSELSISKTVKGLLDFRYLNVGQLDLEGTHELGVFWGLRLDF